MDNFHDLIPPERIILETEKFIAGLDGFPVSSGHTLIYSKKLKSDFFALDESERNELAEAIVQVKEYLYKKYEPDAFNIGMNCGIAAGQTIMHFHCHVIPRYKGDMRDPRGGIRNCIPDKGNYLK